MTPRILVRSLAATVLAAAFLGTATWTATPAPTCPAPPPHTALAGTITKSGKAPESLSE